MTTFSSLLFVTLFCISMSNGLVFECKTGNVMANVYCDDYCRSLHPQRHIAGSCAKNQVSCLCQTTNEKVIVSVVQPQIPAPYTEQPLPLPPPSPIPPSRPLGDPFRFQPSKVQRLVCDGSPAAAYVCNSFCTNVQRAVNGVCNEKELTCRCIGIPFAQKDSAPATFQIAQLPGHFQAWGNQQQIQGPLPQIQTPLQHITQDSQLNSFSLPQSQPERQLPAQMTAQHPAQFTYPVIPNAPAPSTLNDVLHSHQQQQSQLFHSPPQTAHHHSNSFQQEVPNNFPHQNSHNLQFNHQPQEPQPGTMVNQNLEQVPQTMNFMGIPSPPISTQATLTESGTTANDPEQPPDQSSTPTSTDTPQKTPEAQTISNLEHDDAGFTLPAELDNLNSTTTSTTTPTSTFFTTTTTTTTTDTTLSVAEINSDKGATSSTENINIPVNSYRNNLQNFQPLPLHGHIIVPTPDPNQIPMAHLGWRVIPGQNRPPPEVPPANKRSSFFFWQ